MALVPKKKSETCSIIGQKLSYQNLTLIFGLYQWSSNIRATFLLMSASWRKFKLYMYLHFANNIFKVIFFKLSLQ